MFLSGFDPFSFFAGFIAASVFWWLIARARPLWNEIRSGAKEKREAAQTRKSSTVEENHRRNTLRRAQGMHLAAPLFALDEILQTPLVLAPKPIVEPGAPPVFEDVISQTVPYLPGWPEIGAAFGVQTLTLPQALAGNSNLVIIGQPGIGKSVALAHIASLLANRSSEMGAFQEVVPFLLHVADLKLPAVDEKNALTPITDAFSENAAMLDLGRLPAFIQSAFKSGQAFLLVDGYDEITPAEQQVVSDYFKLLIKLFPQNRIIATGSPEYLDGLIALGFAPLALAAWSAKQHETFIRQWGQLWTQTVSLESWAQTGGQQVDPLLLNIWLGSDNSNLTPLELTLKAWGAYAGESLGPHVLEGIASHIRRIAPPNTPLAALETLAMQATLSAQAVFDPRKARDWVRSFEPSEERVPGQTGELKMKTGELKMKTDAPPAEEKPAADKKTEKVATPTYGLLSKMVASGLLVSYANHRMRFVHPIFAGYLAGRAMTNYNAEEPILNQTDWAGKYLALRYFAAFGDASSLVQSLLEFSRLPMHRPLMAAARFLRDAPKNAPWRGKIFGSLAAILQTEGIPLGVRGQAMAAFVHSNDSNAAPLFRQFATATSFELVHLVVLGLGAIKDAKAAQVLAQTLNAPSISVRRAACLALVSIGTNEALELVAHTLLSGDEDVRRAAAEALASDPLEGHAVLKEGLEHSDILLRRAIAYGLGRLDNAWAIEALQKVQISDEQWVVRNAATEVLDAKTNIASRAPHKLKAPSDSPWLVEFASKQGVGISPGTPATDILLQALKSDNPETRLAALPYLKFAPSEGVVTQIYHAMYKDDPELREAAFNILWELGASGIKLPDPTQLGLN
ncbi:MAG: HEAT repeat domain-containing protein [Anaerolineales bacterium]|nr:HEAT repeat domain-containing protein [Anaerolineales bacterium]